MIKILFLDDDLRRHRRFEEHYNRPGIIIDYVETVEQAKNALKNNKYDIASLDHDLEMRVMVESGPGTGYEVAEYIADNWSSLKRPTGVICHSYNPEGAQNMYNKLYSCGCPVVIAEFDTDKYDYEYQKIINIINTQKTALLK